MNNLHSPVDPAQPVIKVFNPVTGALMAEVPSLDITQARQRLEKVRNAQKTWGSTSFSTRKALMLNFAEVLYRRREEVATLLSQETGKTLYEAHIFEVVSLYRMARYFGRRAGKILKPRTIRLSLFINRRSVIEYKPRGVVLIIAPWNFPVAIPIGEVIMALMAGNGVVLKPASLTPLVALKLKEIFDEAGFDPDLFQVIPGQGRMASELIGPGVDYVNFTGSTAVGKMVAARCGEKLIPCSMELGGADPAIVLPDADLDHAARILTWGSFAASGQICASVERVYVHQSVYDAFVAKVLACTQALRQGDPLSGKELDLGSMIDPGQIPIVERQIEEARSRGAKILTGGARLGEGSMFFAPTVITGATDDMAVVREETFGPVMPIMPYRDEDEAVARANHSPYALSAYVFGQPGHARKVARRLEAGTVSVNSVLMTYGMPETPWGGPKESGVGRVHGDDGLRHLCEPLHLHYPILPFDLPVEFPYSAKKLSFLWRMTHFFSRLLRQ